MNGNWIVYLLSSNEMFLINESYRDSSLSLIMILSMSHKRWTLSFKSKFSTGTFCSRLEFIGLAPTLSTWVATKFTLAKVCFDSILTAPLRTQPTRVFEATGPSPFSSPVSLHLAKISRCDLLRSTNLSPYPHFHYQCPLIECSSQYIS